MIANYNRDHIEIDNYGAKNNFFRRYKYSSQFSNHFWGNRKGRRQLQAMEFGAKIMVLATFLLLCLIVASSQGETSQNRISRRDIEGGTALINDLDTNFGYPNNGNENVESILRRTLLLKTYWQLCTELDACPEKITKTEGVLPKRSARGGHLFWRTGILVPPKGGK